MEAQQGGTDVLGQLLPYGVGVLVVALVVIWVAKQFFGEFFKKLGGRASDQAPRFFAGGNRFTRRQLARYRESIEDDFQAHRPGFTGETVIDINEVYVPLQSEDDGERQDIYENIREQRRSVVIGPAGAGKSLLLKNSMLMWARGRNRARVPILVELHRCNGSSAQLIDLVVDEIGRCRVHGRPRPDRDRALAEKALADGHLSLLFDGLDEVGRDDHTRVVQSLRDFARRYRDCQIIVTCRDVVYQGQLATEFTHVVRVAEFDDAGIIRLLGNWPGIAGTPAVTEIFENLQKNPALMRLARSPLLLTMIAYLHVEVFSKVGRRLPTSRPAFYDRAISHLLGRDADLDRASSLTVYDVGEKRAVLQRVALALQESSGADVDRRAISLTQLREITQELLPDLNLDGSHIKPLLTEIIDRSQLLVALDKTKSKYAFRHLTLQEYLTAAELADDPERLLEHYRADPLAWRETVKLWCGSSTRDCTRLVADIFGSPELHHKILALECLAEARRIDSEFATLIIQHFRHELDRPGPDRTAIVVAFGAVAADSRPRGQEVLQLLMELARTAEQPTRGYAMQALSASGRLEAAEALAPLARNDEDARNALRSMGELALPVLTARAEGGHQWAVDDLAVVGTPSAATALAGLLWETDGQVGKSAFRAAWHLAALLRNPDIEQGLRDAPGRMGVGATLNWIWRPFTTGKDDPLYAIAGRIAWLLTKSDPSTMPTDITTVDPRLSVPLIVYRSQWHGPVYLNSEQETEIKELAKAAGFRWLPGAFNIQLRNFLTTSKNSRDPKPQLPQLFELLISAYDVDWLTRQLLGMLSWRTQATFAAEVVSPRLGTIVRPRIRFDDWSTVLVARRESRRLWWAFGGTLGLASFATVVLGVVEAIGAVAGADSSGPEWLAYIGLGVLGVFIVSFAGTLITDDDNWAVAFLLSGIAAGVIFLWFGGVSLGTWLSWPLLAGLVLVLAGAATCGMTARHRDRVNDNPFRRCLDAESVELVSRTSVIAA